MILRNLASLVAFAIEAHRHYPKKQKRAKTVRKWDGRTPYGIHPTWCAMMILTETSLPEDLRVVGAQALLLHDILEDTDLRRLPGATPARVRRLVREMTFEGGSPQEMIEVWNRSPECRLLKLYDKVSNLLDGSWMDAAKLAAYRAYTLELAKAAARQYGPGLNIVRIAEALCHQAPGMEEIRRQEHPAQAR